MAIQEIEIGVADLTLGMYVSRLDRPWNNTPYPLQGFHIRSSEDIASLKTYCDHVFIDVAKGRGVLEGSVSSPPRGPRVQREKVVGGEIKLKVRGVVEEAHDVQVTPPISVRKGVYETTVSLRLEAAQASKIAKNLRGNLSLISRQISRGKLADYESLKRNVSDMVDSVLRCPDAFTWLVRLRDKDQYSHDHSLRSALWAVQFARYIGMEKKEISVLCLGTLLKDIGKIKVPNVILRKQNRTEAEELEYRKYVTYGVEMLRNTRKIEPRVISIVRHHAELHNGGGFPEGVMGTKIPLLARIAGIATAYDLISNPRETDAPVASSRAVSLLYNMRGNEFQEDLVVQFIQSIGLYPTGTLVELTTGDIGVVVEQHPKSRLTPQIAIPDHIEEGLNENVFLVDLRDEEQVRKALAEKGRKNLEDIDRIAIARDLEPTGYDIDLTNVANLFMVEEAVKKDGFWSTVRVKLGLDNG
ncbi:MAG: diguanylate cyclase [Gammaproteobacteria bacterium]|nr:MAG: diguanylate cyclase [Gammaproteobacteria bacterium]RLA54861.1 MAG: diguanylate cyclase [Gammaproteobacteria bacterium]